MDQWPALALRDGTLVPSLAFGTGRFRTLANPADTIHHVSEALQLGYTHIGRLRVIWMFLG
jgi:diketogulonate reductase-like aldo/keto reductase